MRAFPLLQYLGGSRRSAFYLTELAGAKAVIKLIPAGTPRTAAQVACWKLAGRLSHPNLVQILEIGLWHADQDQDMCFAVMEYCDESLADLLRQRLLTPAEAREVLAPTLTALKYLHGQGLLHGQIKPSHLLASGDQLKLSCDTIHRNGEGHPSAIESPYDARRSCRPRFRLVEMCGRWASRCMNPSPATCPEPARTATRKQQRNFRRPSTRLSLAA